MNGANGMSEIEGKAARVAVSECGQRANFKPQRRPPQFTRRGGSAVAHLVLVRPMRAVLKYLPDRCARSFQLCAAMIVYVVASLVISVSSASGGLTFAGVPLTPGGTVQANVPLSDLEKSYVSEGGNAVPSHGVAVLVVPTTLDPKSDLPVIAA